MERGWALWSIGGRAVTIVFICVLLFRGLTGYSGIAGEPVFGFGVSNEVFSFEAADALKAAPIRGNILNTSQAQGDALIWRAWPDRPPFIDSRRHLFPDEIETELNEARTALRDDDVATWKPILDRYQVGLPTLPSAEREPRIEVRWRPNLRWAVAIAVVAGLALVFAGGASPFLYYRY